MNKFSVVIPIHNDSRFVPFSLPSVLALEPDEVVVLLDRCSDNSADAVIAVFNRYNICSKLQLIEITSRGPFMFQPSYLRIVGCDLASFDVVLVSAADLVLDSKILEYVDLVGDYGLITFEYRDYPINWRHELKRLLARFLPFPWLGGVRLFDKRLMFKHEDFGELKSLTSEDTHLADTIRKVAKVKYLLSDTLHLRPKESKERHYRRGKLYAIYGRSFFLALCQGIVFFRLSLIKGYIHERFGNKKEVLK